MEWLRKNAGVLGVLITVYITFIGGISWGIRLEQMAQTNAMSIKKNESRIDGIQFMMNEQGRLLNTFYGEWREYTRKDGRQN